MLSVQYEDQDFMVDLGRQSVSCQCVKWCLIIFPGAGRRDRPHSTFNLTADLLQPDCVFLSDAPVVTIEEVFNTFNEDVACHDYFMQD